jgi:hypothetical protein
MREVTAMDVVRALPQTMKEVNVLSALTALVIIITMETVENNVRTVRALITVVSRVKVAIVRSVRMAIARHMIIMEANVLRIIRTLIIMLVRVVPITLVIITTIMEKVENSVRIARVSIMPSREKAVSVRNVRVSTTEASRVVTIVSREAVIVHVQPTTIRMLSIA